MNDIISNQELLSLREQINELDRAGLELLRQRLSLSNQVGRLKQKINSPITDLSREKAVIKDAQSKFEPHMSHKIESFMSTTMRISRENQYEILFDLDVDWLLGSQISQAANKIASPRQIACQGVKGSYSHLVADRIFPGSHLIPVQTFDETCRKVIDGECELAVLPLENTTAGTVNDVYDLLTTAPLYIVKAVSVPIQHKLLLLPNADIKGIRTVLSHPQALAQCSKFIKKMGWNQIAVENTAFAAQQIRAEKNPTFCAIASTEAAFINGLNIADDHICDSAYNQTRFVAISNSLIITDNAERISITFHLTHQSGSLASVLNLFAERGLNLSKIQSRPVPDKPWEYSFWVDLTAKRGDRDAVLALYQLSRELPLLKMMGWYEEIAIEG